MSTFEQVFGTVSKCEEGGGGAHYLTLSAETFTQEECQEQFQKFLGETVALDSIEQQFTHFGFVPWEGLPMWNFPVPECQGSKRIWVLDLEKRY